MLGVEKDQEGGRGDGAQALPQAHPPAPAIDTRGSLPKQNAIGSPLASFDRVTDISASFSRGFGGERRAYTPATEQLHKRRVGLNERIHLGPTSWDCMRAVPPHPPTPRSTQWRICLGRNRIRRVQSTKVTGQSQSSYEHDDKEGVRTRVPLGMTPCRHDSWRNPADADRQECGKDREKVHEMRLSECGASGRAGRIR